MSILPVKEWEQFLDLLRGSRKSKLLAICENGRLRNPDIGQFILAFDRQHQYFADMVTDSGLNSALKTELKSWLGRDVSTLQAEVSTDPERQSVPATIKVAMAVDHAAKVHDASNHPMIKYMIDTLEAKIVETTIY